MIALLMLLFCGIAHGAMVMQRDYVQETRDALALIRAGADKGLWEAIDIIDTCPEDIAPEVAGLIKEALCFAAAKAGISFRDSAVAISLAVILLGSFNPCAYFCCGLAAISGYIIGNGGGALFTTLGLKSCHSYRKYKIADKKLFNFLSIHNALPEGYQQNCAERACACI